MKQTRKKYDAKFKAKVAIEAIKERETLNKLAVKYEVSPVMNSRWKKEVIENSAAALVLATIAALVVSFCTDGQTSSTALKVSPIPAFLLLMLAAILGSRNQKKNE